MQVHFVSGFNLSDYGFEVLQQMQLLQKKYRCLIETCLKIRLISASSLITNTNAEDILPRMYLSAAQGIDKMRTTWGKGKPFSFPWLQEAKKACKLIKDRFGITEASNIFCNLSSWTNVENFLSLGGRMDQRCWLRWWRPAQFWGVQVQPVREFGSNIVFSIISHTIYANIKKLYWIWLVRNS